MSPGSAKSQATAVQLDESVGFRDAVPVHLTPMTPKAGGIPRHKALLALLAVVVFVALPIRLYVAMSATMVSRDGVTFIWYAQELASHPVAEMRAQAQHPLYPAMLLAAHTVVRWVQSLSGPESILADPVVSWPVAGVGVTLTAGLIVVVAVYVLAAMCFNRRVGLIAAVLAATAAEFCQLSADALTDMPHLAFYLFALAAGIRGIRDRRVVWLAVAGVLSGIGFLVRPEGATVAFVIALVLATKGVGSLFASRRGEELRLAVLGVMAVGLGAGLVACPYMLITGKLIQKKSITRFIGGDEKSASCVPVMPALATTVVPARMNICQAGLGVGTMGRAAALIGEYWSRSLRVTFLLPVIVWLIRRRDMPAEATAGRLIVVVLVFHLLLLVALLIRFDYWDLFSLRHVLVLAVLTLPFSAAGVDLVLHVATRRRAVVGVLLAIGLIVPTLPWMLETRYADRLYLRRAAAWIREQDLGHPPRVLTTRHRVAFYADGVYVRSPLEPDAAWILAEARQHQADWLVFDERSMLRKRDSFFDDLYRAAGPGEQLQLVHAESTPAGRAMNRALVYRYRPAP